MRTIKILTSISEDIRENHKTLKDFEDGYYQAFYNDEYTKDQFHADYRIKNGIVVLSECCKYKKIHYSELNILAMKEVGKSKYIIDDSEKNIEKLIILFIKKYVDILRKELEKEENEERELKKQLEEDAKYMQETYDSLKPSL